MAKVSIKGEGDINQISRVLINGVQASGLSCELIDSSERTLGQNKVILLVFEKYYMRSSNRASLTCMLSQSEDTIYVDAVGSGGGQGALFKFSWGSEENFVSIVPSILSEHGFS